MSQTERLADLGFAAAKVPHGTHICQIYTDERERDEALRHFVSRGLANGEATACFSDTVDRPALEAWLARESLSACDERLTVSGSTSVYFPDGRFDPLRMLELLRAFHRGSVEAGRTGARVIGEMSPEINRVPGGSRLFEYESRVNQLLRDHPVTAVCQYDARAFSGATIMDVLSVHPVMVVHGALVNNPFFVPPENLAGR
ncbi:MAG: MEDS domain-containing protein [Myxococcales bacterium]